MLITVSRNQLGVNPKEITPFPQRCSMSSKVKSSLHRNKTMKKDERKKGNKNLNHMYFFHAVYAQLKASGKNIRGVKDTMAMSN